MRKLIAIIFSALEGFYGRGGLLKDLFLLFFEI